MATGDERGRTGRGRPPQGPELVGRLEGSEAAQVRARLVLETIAGRCTIGEACRELGIGESAFHEMREKALTGLVSALEPKASGRPRRPESTPQERELARVREENRDLKIGLRSAQVREEIALVMPHLLRPRGGGDKKKIRRGPGRRPLLENLPGPPGGGARLQPPGDRRPGGAAGEAAEAPGPAGPVGAAPGGA